MLSGMVLACMGVASSKPSLFTAFNIAGLRFKSENFVNASQSPLKLQVEAKCLTYLELPRKIVNDVDNSTTKNKQ